MTTSPTLISVVVPTYNYARYLHRALDSILGQWADDLELIIVDDGSTDNTAQIAQGYVSRFASVRYVYQDNAGPAAARNHGVSLAQGRFVLPVDSDDELINGAIAVLRAMVQATPHAQVIVGAHISVYPDGRERTRLPVPVPAMAPRAITCRYLLEKRISFAPSSILICRDLLLQRPYPEQLRTGEDIPVFAYLLVTAEQIMVTDQVIARIHKHPDSLRNDRRDEEALALAMVQEVFTGLPPECQSLRTRYEAQRYLSLFRAAVRDDDRSTARRFYRRALYLSAKQALRWVYVRKAIRLFFKD
ncbi:MAG: glycosyltransferase family 2 protein [Janthinobacterium lividum]|jgi:glycosyltransferase involved in cell wall biosynthesis|uniref:glycosyltransferase family 2 protein n=1 Tax=Pseudomonas sp. MWU16-30317 TaxID=2878095 RepID=UPI001CFA333D|nr:glycosyltransferase family A protein [Pseudomonas sp. MWU16-30317]